jgi:NAD+ synthase (glutamine-hydrolysing)
MRFALAQLNFTVGAFDRNFEQIADAAARARREGVDLLLLSELATTGYPPRDLLNHRRFVEANLALRDRVAALSDGTLGILVGCAEPNEASEGKPLFNTAVLCHEGRIVARHRKTLLPTYDVFDEDRYFEPGAEASPIVFKGVRLGVTVCEEVWNDAGFWPRRLYPHDPIVDLASAGVDVFLNISSSPFTTGKAALRREMIRQQAIKHRRAFLYVNQVGGNDELIFDGHSLAFAPNGDLLARATDFDEDFLIVDVEPEDMAGLKPGRTNEASAEATASQPERSAQRRAAPLAAVSQSREEEVWGALKLGLRDYTRKCGFRSVVLGLSGGIDSALTAVLAAEALGPAHVTGVAMPTRYSSAHSLEDAETLARNLGIRFHTIPIDAIFQSHLDALAPALPGALGVAEENIQARVRGAVLMAFSNTEGSMLLSTGNKSELAVGYCTLYGDMCGGLAAISDVPKTLVYDLARYVNREREVIPRSSITKAPSAELRPDQTDQDTLPPYEVIDAVIEGYVEKDEDIAAIVAGGIDRAVAESIIGRIDRNEYKRRQAAPGLKITLKAFGVGRRYPIAADYRSLGDLTLGEPVAETARPGR